jgi:C-terminal processing protease CtpA/Prc
MKIRPHLIAAFLSMLTAYAYAANPGYFGISVSVDGDGFFLNPTLNTVKIEKVVPGSPAAKAGINPGDLIVEIEGHPIPGTKADLLKPYMQREVGQSTRFLIKKTSGEIVSAVLVAAPKVDTP